jgi:hypothetical protein
MAMIFDIENTDFILNLVRLYNPSPNQKFKSIVWPNTKSKTFSHANWQTR